MCPVRHRSVPGQGRRHVRLEEHYTMDSIDIQYQIPEDPKAAPAKHRWGRIAGATVVAGAVLGGLAVTHSQSPQPAAASGTSTSLTAQTIASSPPQTPTGAAGSFQG